MDSATKSSPAPDEVVDVAQLIDRKVIRALRGEFKAADGEVEVEQFVEMMMRHVECTEETKGGLLCPPL